MASLMRRLREAEIARDALLEAVEVHKSKWGGAHDIRPIRNEPLAAVWDDDQALYRVADRITAPAQPKDKP